MKTSPKKIIFIMLLFVVILAAVWLATGFPPITTSDATGTIGKVEKYRKVQMTEKDVLLRSEFVKDTSSIAKTIKGLLVYNAFAVDFAREIDEWVAALKGRYTGEKNLKELGEYSQYIKNNTRTVENTIGVLSDIYKSDTTQMSLDIEKKLKDFDSFVHGMAERNTMLSVIIPDLAKHITSVQKAGKTGQDEIENLKKLHDKMLLRNTVYAVVCANESMLKLLVANTLMSKEYLGVFNKEKLSIFDNKGKPLGVIFNNEKLSLITASGEKLNVLKSNEKLNAIRNSEMKGNANEAIELTSNQSLNTNVLNAEKLGTSIFRNYSSAVLGIIFPASQQLQMNNYMNYGYSSSKLSSSELKATLDNSRLSGAQMARPY